ncbi:MAG TPA: hypothetical protein VF748_14920 [Candidatus Acidoferrum sp.]
MTPEGLTKQEIKKLLDSYGDALYYFMPVQSGYGTRTIDFLICFRGRFIAVEAKREGARAARFQQRILDGISKAGGLAFCVDTAEELKTVFAWLTAEELKTVLVECGMTHKPT